MRHPNRGIALLVFFLGMVVMQAAYGQAPVLTITKDANGGITLGIKKDVPKKDDTKKDDTKKDDSKKDDTKKDEPKIVYHKFPTPVQGHIVSVDEGKKSLKVSVEVQVPNPGGQNELVQATLNLQRVNRQDINAVNNAVIRLQKAQAGMVKIEKQEKTFDSIDTVKVRTVEPPQQFDDKGNLKKYTAKEKAELKGTDKSTPGYPAEFSDLHPGMVVELKMVSKKDPAKFANKANLTPEEQDDIKPMMSQILGAEMPKQPGAPGS